MNSRETNIMSDNYSGSDSGLPEKNSNKRKIIITVIILTLILIVSGIIIYHNRAGQNKTYSKKGYATILQDGEVIATYNLDEASDSDFTITSENDCYNKIEILGGDIRIYESSCPEKICINQGWLSDSMVPIVCMPNKLVIILSDTPYEASVDAISY